MENFPDLMGVIVVIFTSGVLGRVTRRISSPTTPISVVLVDVDQGVTEEDEVKDDSKAANEAEMIGQAAPDKLRQELKRRKKEADQ